jgi:K+-sensing histidine kinase KdpD
VNAELEFERYWLLAAVCLVAASALVHLVLRQHVTLQRSLGVLAALVALVVLGASPHLTAVLAHDLGFVLPSNFFFTVAIGTLGLLHVGTLVTLSRLEMRSITLTQELGLSQEKIDRLTRNPPVAKDASVDPGGAREGGAPRSDRT